MLVKEACGSYSWVVVTNLGAWPIHTVLLVLVVGCFHTLAIFAGRPFPKLEIAVATDPLQTVVVGVDGNPWAIPYGFGL